MTSGAADENAGVAQRFTVWGPSPLVNELIAGRIAVTTPGAVITVAADPSQLQTRVRVEPGGGWILIGSMAGPEAALAQAIANGALAAISLHDGLAELDRALMALTGGTGPYVPDRVIRQMATRNALRPTAGPDPAKVTPREREVLGLVIEGYTNSEVAGRLGMSPNTVRTHLRSLFEKLGVSNRSGLMRRAATMGLLDDDARREPRSGWDQTA
jgi:DNA-binding NarL/FixJ family response regulator